VPTPLGNLEDITLRALRVLGSVDWVAAEDTRRTAILFQAHGLRRPLFAHHAHNEHAVTPSLVRRLREGESGALVTDAGTPGIADPGFFLARAAREAGIAVTVLPGPTMVTAALLASGFPPQPFVFLGYVPATAGQRRSFFEGIRQEERTVVAFESPHRLARSLEVLADTIPQRRIAVVREFSKLHEEVAVGTAAELRERFGAKVRGEVTLVFHPLARSSRARAGEGEVS